MVKESSRITVGVNQESDGIISEVVLYLNESGTNDLIRELQSLSEQSDHFHLFSKMIDDDGILRTKTYSENEKTSPALKVCFRPDKWDREFYPEVFDDDDK